MLAKKITVLTIEHDHSLNWRLSTYIAADHDKRPTMATHPIWSEEGRRQGEVHIRVILPICNVCCSYIKCSNVLEWLWIYHNHSRSFWTTLPSALILSECKWSTTIHNIIHSLSSQSLDKSDLIFTLNAISVETNKFGCLSRSKFSVGDYPAMD